MRARAARGAPHAGIIAGSVFTRCRSSAMFVYLSKKIKILKAQQGSGDDKGFASRAGAAVA